MANLALDDPITKLSSVTTRVATALQRGLGIYTIRDLLWHIPSRYEDLSTVTPIHDLSIGSHATVMGKIVSTQNIRTWKRRLNIFEAVLTDETGSVKLVWFNQPWLAEKIEQGGHILASGKYTAGKNGAYIAASFWEGIDGENPAQKQRGVLPIYPETEGVTSKWLRHLISQALTRLETVPETLPPEVLEHETLLPIDTALREAHAATTPQKAARAQERLSFDELFLIECAALQSKLRTAKQAAPAIPMNVELIKKFIGLLPWQLTDGQRKTIFQILTDMERIHPMNRLLVGEVGSGKTLVAAAAMLNAAKAGWQSVIMAPTEILALQHFKELHRLLKPFGIRIGLFTGSQAKATPKRLSEQAITVSKPKLFKDVRSGEISILVGTHALISKRAQGTSSVRSTLLPREPLRFKRLALAIVDEQHRFGVEQRAALKKMQQALNPEPFVISPHFLTMTATPIPRSLALTVFGDLDLSLMHELPAGRKDITTELIPEELIERAYEAVRTEIAAGRQAYIIFPLVKKSDKLAAKAAEAEYNHLKNDIFAGYSVGLLHGQLKSKEKETVMNDFKKGKTNILVATTVIEVGIDVPNATLMIIEGADRFGLSQLHQLRGRIGRGEYSSRCFLVLSQGMDNKRLKTFARITSGPRLAEEDLALRGPGDILGTRQAGMSEIIAAALKNISLIERARDAAKRVLETDPNIKKYPGLGSRVARISSQLHLS